MIAEKVRWLRHEGMQIFSIDAQPGGHRLATGGGGHKARIWSLKPARRRVTAAEPSLQLLATLRDHFGSVNCIRWAQDGRFIASGSDDLVILIHERKPGSGTTEFGSREPPDVENWKVTTTLRGHTADVVDLNWSPDDSTLASASLDNTIHTWNMSNGICTAFLRGHSVTPVWLKELLGILLVPSLQVNRTIKHSLFGEQVIGASSIGKMDAGPNLLGLPSLGGLGGHRVAILLPPLMASRNQGILHLF